MYSYLSLRYDIRHIICSEKSKVITIVKEKQNFSFSILSVQIVREFNFQATTVYGVCGVIFYLRSKHPWLILRLLRIKLYGLFFCPSSYFKLCKEENALRKPSFPTLGKFKVYCCILLLYVFIVACLRRYSLCRML